MPFANGAPHVTVDMPALTNLALKKKIPICGKDFKSGQTFMKTLLAPGIKAKMLGLTGWFSTNILGNRDGEVLDDPDNFRSKEVTKASVLEHIIQPDNLSGAVQRLLPQGADQLLSAARRRQRELG